MENIAQGDRTLGKDPRRLARKIADRSVHLYVATGCEVHSEPLDGCYGLTQDAGRHGNPAEDIENYAFYAAKQESGMWLPSMVHWLLQ